MTKPGSSRAVRRTWHAAYARLASRSRISASNFSVAGGSLGLTSSFFFNLLKSWMTRNKTKAMMMKLMVTVMKLP